MNKDFDKWNTEKKRAHTETPRLYTVLRSGGADLV